MWRDLPAHQRPLGERDYFQDVDLLAGQRVDIDQVAAVTGSAVEFPAEALVCMPRDQAQPGCACGQPGGEIRLCFSGGHGGLGELPADVIHPVMMRLQPDNLGGVHTYLHLHQIGIEQHAVLHRSEIQHAQPVIDLMLGALHAAEAALGKEISRGAPA